MRTLTGTIIVNLEIVAMKRWPHTPQSSRTGASSPKVVYYHTLFKKESEKKQQKMDCYIFKEIYD